MVHNYTPQVFDKLLVWPSARQNIEQAEKHLSALGRVICKYGLQDYLGLALLHKHFDLHGDERLIERFDKNQTQIKPRMVKDHTAIIPYLWKTDGADWYPLEFCLSHQIPAAVVELSRNITTHKDLLSQLAVYLNRLNLTDVCGLTLLHRQAIRLRPCQLLVETTHSPARTLIWAAHDEHEFAEQDLFPTTWQFHSNGSDISVNFCGHCGHS